MASKSFNVAIKVVSQNGRCGQSHYVGENWLVVDKSPGGICLSALASMLPILKVLHNTGEGTHANKDPDIAWVACPNAKRQVVFELRRVRK
jgi:uncharacterized repeat protein (TIGR04076 family)